MNTTKNDIEDLMVIEKQNSEEEILLIVRRSDFTEQKYCECYDQYGQVNGCTDSGCYAIDNNVSDAASNLSKAIKDSFGEEIDFDDEDLEFSEQTDGTFALDLISNDFGEELNKRINDFIAAWRAEHENHTLVTAYNYYDGHNWQTVVIDAEGYPEPDYSEISEARQKEILSDLEIAEDCGSIYQGTGTLYKGQKYQFETSVFPSNFEQYRVYDLEEEETEE